MINIKYNSVIIIIVNLIIVTSVLYFIIIFIFILYFIFYLFEFELFIYTEYPSLQIAISYRSL